MPYDAQSKRDAPRAARTFMRLPERHAAADAAIFSRRRLLLPFAAPLPAPPPFAEQMPPAVFAQLPLMILF